MVDASNRNHLGPQCQRLVKVTVTDGVKTWRASQYCNETAVTELDGEWLCQHHADMWVRDQAYHES